MLFKKKRLFIGLLVFLVHAQEASAQDLMDAVKQRPVIVAKTIALAPLGVWALCFSIIAVGSAYEAYDAYRENMKSPTDSYRSDIASKSVNSVISALLAIGCAKLMIKCVQSIKSDLG